MSPMPSPGPINDAPLRIEICKDTEDMARRAAGMFVASAGRALGSWGRFAVALAGGETPRRMYQLLTSEHFAYQIVWPAVQVYFGDERCVPPDDPHSNYRMASEMLLSKVGLPPGNIHRMHGEEEPVTAATHYEQELREYLGPAPSFDLVLLGMGADGHVASLFPGSAALVSSDRLTAVTHGPDGLSRLTLTLPVINAARTVAILVSGEEKAATLRSVLGAGAKDSGLPVHKVRPVSGQLLWILDGAAASMLDEPSE